jgi:hypothetical protein
MTDMIPVPMELLEKLRECAMESLSEAPRREIKRYVNIVDYADALLREAAQTRPTEEELCSERVLQALDDAGFRLQDDYYLAHGASLMSEESHEIIHTDTVDAIVRAAGAAEDEELRRDAERYRELLFAVESKFPGESRHETALRYIRKVERTCCGPSYGTAAEKREGE